MERWTIKQLDGMSDLRFAQAILNEHLSRFSQPYSPLASKVRSAAARLDELAAVEEATAEAESQPKQYMSYEEVFEDLEWTCLRDDDGSLELEKHSPAGEDFIFNIEGEDIPSEVAEYAKDFDKDEHVELWVNGRGERAVPGTIRELMEDAEAIQNMLNELAEALASVQNNCELGLYDCSTCIIHGCCDREDEETMLDELTEGSDDE